ncbi:MAG: 8-oxo-dGTP diphosphatase [Micropruina sp.]
MFTPVIGVLGYVLSPEADRVLMVLRSRDGDSHQGKYNGLGGKLEAGEDVVGCLHRELAEEAGITVVTQRLRGTVSWPGFDGENWLGFVFLVDCFEGTVPECNEDGPLSWVRIDDLARLPMWEGDRHFLPLVFDADPRPFHGVMPYAEGRPVSWSYHR